MQTCKTVNSKKWILLKQRIPFIFHFISMSLKVTEQLIYNKKAANSLNNKNNRKAKLNPQCTTVTFVSKWNQTKINDQNLTPFYIVQPVTLIIYRVPYSDRNSRESVKEKNQHQGKTIPHHSVFCKLKPLHKCSDLYTENSDGCKYNLYAG